MASSRIQAQLDFPQEGGRRPLVFGPPLRVFEAFEPYRVLEVIREAEAAARQGYWVLGMVAYEAAPAFDPAFVVREPMKGMPLAFFAVHEAPLPDDELADDQVETVSVDGPWRMEVDRQRFDEDIARVQEDILAGRFYQSNHTTRLRSSFSGSPLALYRALCVAQPSDYRLYLDGGDWQVLSVSPELFFDWDQDGFLTTRPMKGTAPRCADGKQDAAAAEALQASAKERAENLMIVDLLRNDLSRVAQTGTVSVPHLFALEALPSVWQMTSTVQCRPLPDIGLAEVFTALFPCGSVTGAPKVTAMQSIAEREVSSRGPYCGALGVIRPGGHATFSVGIRTVVLRNDGESGQAECGIGSGITMDATAAAEFAEWQAKRRFLLRASANFALLETLRLEEGHFAYLERHLTRLAAAAEHFGFVCDLDHLRRLLEDHARAWLQGCWRVRLRLDRLGQAHIESSTLEAHPIDCRIRLAQRPVVEDREFLQYKTSHRFAYEEHREPDYFDVVLYNQRGELTEFTRGNLVLEIEGRRLTPASTCGLLPGVLRAEMLARGKIDEAVLTRNDLDRATCIWFINALRGWVVVRMD